MKQDVILDIIKNIMYGHKNIPLCIIYGSLAKNQLKKESDIDICIGSESPISTEYRLKLSMELEKKLKRIITIVDITKSNGIFLKEVLTKGITIKNEKPFLKAKHIIRMLDFVEDLLPINRKTLYEKALRFAHGS